MFPWSRRGPKRRPFVMLKRWDGAEGAERWEAVQGPVGGDTPKNKCGATDRLNQRNTAPVLDRLGPDATSVQPERAQYACPAPLGCYSVLRNSVRTSRVRLRSS